jgi:hypothetical protein
MSLARLSSIEAADRAHALLRPAYEALTEGRDLADLKSAAMRGPAISGSGLAMDSVRAHSAPLERVKSCVRSDAVRGSTLFAISEKAAATRPASSTEAAFVREPICVLLTWVSCGSS